MFNRLQGKIDVTDLKTRFASWHEYRTKIIGIVEGAGLPVGVFITGANVHEVTRVDSTPRAKVVHQEADGQEVDESLLAP